MSGENMEKMTAYAQAFLKTGFVGSRKVSLVFSQRRIVVATITKELEKEEAKKAKKAAKAGGKGFLGQMAASTLLLAQSFERRYSTMTPAEVLSENRDNFDIPFDSISRAVLKIDTTRDFEGLDTGEEFSLEIRASEGKHKFKIQGYSDTIMAILKAVLKERFVISK